MCAVHYRVTGSGGSVPGNLESLWNDVHVQYVQTVILDRYIMYSTVLSSTVTNLTRRTVEVELVDREDYYIDFLN